VLILTLILSSEIKFAGVRNIEIKQLHWKLSYAHNLIFRESSSQYIPASYSFHLLRVLLYFKLCVN